MPAHQEKLEELHADGSVDSMTKELENQVR